MSLIAALALACGNDAAAPPTLGDAAAVPDSAVAATVDAKNAPDVDAAKADDAKVAADAVAETFVDADATADAAANDAPTPDVAQPDASVALGAACDPCQVAEDCAAGLVCAVYAGAVGAFCAKPCKMGPSSCAAGYVCTETKTIAGKAATACILDQSGEPTGCQCSPAAVAAKAKTTCVIANDAGACAGVRVCGAGGLGACTAAIPATEQCDGIDNDCDNQTDEATCDDGAACTTDSCSGPIGCVHVPIDGNIACSDGTECTSGDVCNQGECVGQPQNCDDTNGCTADSCDPKLGCVHLPTSATCSDGDACTVGDACNNGLCAGKPKSCDDANPCTDNNCTASDGCINAPVSATCTDGDACTTSDFCQGGACVGKILDCEDDDPCTTDPCDSAAGCVHGKVTGVPCNDKNPCTTGDQCFAGSCSGQAVICNDGNPCTSEVCDPKSGCVSTSIGDGQSCDDGSACTGGDVCAGGVCGGNKIACVDGNVCTDDACDSKKGCVFLPNSLTCTDANTCTIQDTCLGGVCTGKNVACSDGNLCTADGCKSGTGCVYTPLATGPCEDGNPCTSADTCKNGVCQPGLVPTSCDDGNPCTADSCSKVSGCLHAPLAAPTCTDNNPCTVGDFCKAGSCAPGTTALNCNDANVCTADACDAKAGCTHSPSAGACNDNNVCTAGEACSGGICKPATIKTCDDANPCTTDSCNPFSGLCSNAFNTLPCDDGVACTSGDVCALGKCAGKPATDLWSAYVGPTGTLGFGAVARVGSDFAVLSNTTTSPLGTSRCSAVRVDATGKTIWQVVFDTNVAQRPMSIRALADGTLLAVYAVTTPFNGTDIAATKLSATGAVQWTKNLGELKDDWPQGLVVFADGSFALGEHHSNAQPTAQNLTVSRYSATAVKVWTTALGSPTYVDEAFDITATVDGGIAAVGYTLSKGAGMSDGWVVKLEAAAGKQVWEATFGGAQHDRFAKVAAMADGGLALWGSTRSKGNAAGAGDLWLVRTDANGKMLWEKTLGAAVKTTVYTGLETDNDAVSLAQMNDGGLTLLARADDLANGNTDWRAYRVTAKGDPIWTKSWGDTAADQPWQVIGLANDQLLLAGAHLFPANSDIRPWLVRADAWGNSDCKSAGLCLGLTPALCGDDGNPCTDDVCDPAKGCAKANNTKPCAADNVACTPDVCGNGKCNAAPANDALCDDKKPWTADKCDPIAGCTNACADAVAAKPAQRVTIPAGDFWMGCNATTDAECGSQEKPQHKVTVAAYDIDVYEVTVAQYKACVTAGKCAAPATYAPQCNWNVACKDQHPVNCVTWQQGQDFCAWAGGRLPTEAEWEKAARGGCEKYPGQNCQTAMPKYPWGNTGLGCTNAVTQNGCGTGSTLSVGSKPTGKSIYGVHDLIGNVLEWVGDYYSGTYFATSPASNPTGPIGGTARVVKGGAFGGYMTQPAEQRNGTRYDYVPASIGYGSGFRCVVPGK